MATLSHSCACVRCKLLSSFQLVIFEQKKLLLKLGYKSKHGINIVDRSLGPPFLLAICSQQK